MNPNTIIFLHIPKTGGRSLQAILLRKYPSDEAIINAHDRLNEIAQWSDERKRKIRYLQGHLTYGVHKLLPQKCSYITTLRDPIERVISHYYFMKRATNHSLNKIILQQNMNLEDYIKSGVSNELNNDQTKIIAGIPKKSPIQLDEMLRIAKNNIDKEFLAVGVLEEFNKTLLMLKKHLDLQNIFYGIRNQTIERPQQEQISNRTLQIINENNYADIELYDHVKKTFAEAIKNEGPRFNNELRNFERLNQPYSYIFYLVRRLKNKLFNTY